MADTEIKKHPRRRRGRRGRKNKGRAPIIAQVLDGAVPVKTTVADKVASLRKRLQAIKGKST